MALEMILILPENEKIRKESRGSMDTDKAIQDLNRRFEKLTVDDLAATVEKCRTCVWYEPFDDEVANHTAHDSNEKRDYSKSIQLKFCDVKISLDMIQWTCHIKALSIAEGVWQCSRSQSIRRTGG